MLVEAFVYRLIGSMMRTPEVTSGVAQMSMFLPSAFIEASNQKI